MSTKRRSSLTASIGGGAPDGISIRGEFSSILQKYNNFVDAGSNSDCNIFNMPGDRRFKSVRAGLVSIFSGYENHTHTFSLSEIQQMLRIGSIFARIDACKGSVSLPKTKLEMLAFASRLAAALKIAQEVTIFAPVCPDYGKGSDFYNTIGRSVSPEANSAIRALETLSPILSGKEFGLSLPFSVKILVANTETDVKEIIQKCAGGNIEAYNTACEGSAEEMRGRLRSVQGVHVSTFTGFFANSFRERQYAYERLIRGRMTTDACLAERISATSRTRERRYEQILGRQERENELTIRYMAQYAALAGLLRSHQKGSVILNYDTPNLPHFNIGLNSGIKMQDEPSDDAMPVLVSFVKREFE